MSAHTANSKFSFELPSLSYIDAKWEEPSLRAPVAVPQRASGTGLAAWLSRRVTGIATWYRNKQAIAELATMSERELADIGLTQSDVSRAFDPAYNQDLRQRGVGA